jgi:hypothetical protein
MMRPRQSSDALRGAFAALLGITVAFGSLPLRKFGFQPGVDDGVELGLVHLTVSFHAISRRRLRS